MCAAEESMYSLSGYIYSLSVCNTHCRVATPQNQHLSSVCVNVSRTEETMNKSPERRTNQGLQIVPLDTQKSLCFFSRQSLLTEAEVQAGALCDRGGGACTGYSTGGDTAIFKKKTEIIQSNIFVAQKQKILMHICTDCSNSTALNLRTNTLFGTHPTFLKT